MNTKHFKNHLFFAVKQVIRIIKKHENEFFDKVSFCKTPDEIYELRKKRAADICFGIANYLNEYFRKNDTLSDNDKVFIICCVTAQLYLNGYNLLDKLLPNINTELVDDKYHEYIKSIYDIFDCLKQSKEFVCTENIEGWYNHLDLETYDEDTYEEYFDHLRNAIRKFPELEYAYFFILAEFVSVFGVNYKQDNKSHETAELIKASQRHLSREFFMFSLGGYIDFVDLESNQSKRCQQGEFEVDGEYYFVGIPFSLYISNNEKDDYYDKTFVEVPSSEVNYEKIAGLNANDGETALLYKSKYRYTAWHIFMPAFLTMPLFSRLLEFIVGENVYKLLEEYNSHDNSYNEVIKVLNNINKTRNSSRSSLSEEDQINYIYSRYDDIIRNIYIDNSFKNEITAKLVKDFGKEKWNKLTKDAQDMLISGEITYNTLKNIPDIDYSAAVIPLTKALENILNESVYKKSIFYELKRYSYTAANYTKTNAFFIDKQKISIAASNSFILGNEKYYLKDSKKRGYRIKDSLELGTCGHMLKVVVDNMSSFSMQVLKTNYAQHLDGVKNIDELIDLIKEIADKYRNPAAHKDGIDKTKLEACRDDILVTKKAIKNILSIIK